MPAHNTLYTLPNALSVLRGALGPLMLALLVTDWAWGLPLALGLMLFAEATDIADGYIARHFDQESIFGRLLDPVCDSIYHLSVFLAFLSKGWMPAWMLFIIYARDLAVPYIRTFARQAGHDLPVRGSGKLKTAVHAVAQVGIVALALGFFGPAFKPASTLGAGLLLLATLASLYSLVDYAGAAYKLIRE